MSQTFDQMLEKVEEFHNKHDFANEENNGHDMSYRILLTIEELGELAEECDAKFNTKSVISIELADVTPDDLKKWGYPDSKLLPIPGK